MGHEPSITGDHRVGMKQVVLDHSSILVCHMLQLLARAHVAQREDSFGTRPEVTRRQRSTHRRPPRSHLARDRACRHSATDRSRPAGPLPRAFPALPGDRRPAAVRPHRPCSGLHPRWFPRRTSTRRPSNSVNRSATSESSLRSSTSERFSTVTDVPNAEKTWANSAETYPPPMMIMDRGSSDSLITVSEV